MLPDHRTVPIADRWAALGDMERCVSVLQLCASTLLASFLPLTAHWMNHSTDYTHLETHIGHTVNEFSSVSRSPTFRELTLSGWQRISVQAQSLVKDDVTNPVGQEWVEFWQLHVHSKESQHFVFFVDSWRWAGQSGGSCWEHSSLLHTRSEKEKCGITKKSHLERHLFNACMRCKRDHQPTALMNRLAFAGVFQNHCLTVLTARDIRQITVHQITHWGHKVRLRSAVNTLVYTILFMGYFIINSSLNISNSRKVLTIHTLHRKVWYFWDSITVFKSVSALLLLLWKATVRSHVEIKTLTYFYIHEYPYIPHSYSGQHLDSFFSCRISQGPHTGAKHTPMLI